MSISASLWSALASLFRRSPTPSTPAGRGPARLSPTFLECKCTYTKMASNKRKSFDYYYYYYYYYCCHTHQERCTQEKRNKTKTEKMIYNIMVKNSGLLDSIPSPTEGLRAPGPTTNPHTPNRYNCQKEHVQACMHINITRTSQKH